MISIRENPVDEGVIITHKVATNESIREKAKLYIKSMKDAIWLSGGVHWFVKENGTIYSVFSRSYEEATEEEIESVKTAHNTLLEQISMFKSTMKDEEKTMYEKVCSRLNIVRNGHGTVVHGVKGCYAIFAKSLGYVPSYKTFDSIMRDILDAKLKYSNEEIKASLEEFLKVAEDEQNESNAKSNSRADA